MRKSALFVANCIGFFRNLWCVRTDRGLSQCGQGKGMVNFSGFCADIFYGWTLRCLIQERSSVAYAKKVGIESRSCCKNDDLNSRPTDVSVHRYLTFEAERVHRVLIRLGRAFEFWRFRSRSGFTIGYFICRGIKEGAKKH